MKNSFCLLTIGLMILMSSCMPKFEDGTPAPETPVSSADKLNIPAGFDFSTTNEVKFDIGAFDNADGPIRGIAVSVYSSPENELLVKGLTGTNGIMSISQKIPSYVKKVSVQISFIGLPSEIITDVKNNSVKVTFGGKNPITYGNIYDSSPVLMGARAEAQDYPTISPIGEWNDSGVPKYLDPTRDVLTTEFLRSINESLPEGRNMKLEHPDYLKSSNRNYLIIKELADVWITFVHEGASWLNTLGYYTFDINNPPTKIKDIQKVNIIFPNVSYSGSGGGLVSGDRVKIGRFPAGTGIGFVLLANAYSYADKKVGSGFYAHYSNDNFNIETNADLRRHLIVLNDPATKRLILSFEDVSRESNSDNDFNDALFYAISNPVKAMDTNGIPLVDGVSDRDGDGVDDSNDEYPDDPTKAVNNYSNSENAFSTLAYEDLWPYKGDYDMNDLVVNYQFREVLNAGNEVTEINMKAYVKAIGASYACGWGFEMPIDPSAVQSVTGSSIKDGVVRLSANGLEADQRKATIIVFDNAFKQMHSTGGFVNTMDGVPFVPVASTDTLQIRIKFTSPIAKDILGSAPYNPFLFKSDQRGKEVHLINMEPTSKADLKLFGTGHDKSSIASKVYYKTANGMPWALNLYSDFKYPYETKPIIDAYSKFASWAESGGLLFPDWYISKTGYTDDSKIYKAKK